MENEFYYFKGCQHNPEVLVIWFKEGKDDLSFVVVLKKYCHLKD